MCKGLHFPQNILLLDFIVLIIVFQHIVSYVYSEMHTFILILIISLTLHSLDANMYDYCCMWKGKPTSGGHIVICLSSLAASHL